VEAWPQGYTLTKTGKLSITELTLTRKCGKPISPLHKKIFKTQLIIHHYYQGTLFVRKSDYSVVLKYKNNCVFPLLI
jgi:hypothetical protein